MYLRSRAALAHSTAHGVGGTFWRHSGQSGPRQTECTKNVAGRSEPRENTHPFHQKTEQYGRGRCRSFVRQSASSERNE
eukprot:1514926-Pleurochrysis_carterae.AAC.1